MNFLDILVRARRYLRDPEALIWDAEQLCLYWNEAKDEIAQKTGYFTRARTLRYPSQGIMTYQWDWEYEYTHADRLPAYKMFRVLQQSDMIITYPWEATYSTTDIDSTDEQYRVTQWWEAYYATSAEPPKVVISDNLVAIRYAAFDNSTITHRDERVIKQGDGYYKTTQGEAQNYYFTDDVSKEIVIYPVPTIDLNAYLTSDGVYVTVGGAYVTVEDSFSSVFNNELLKDTVSFYADKAYTHAWEDTYDHAGDDPYLFGTYSTTDKMTFMYTWEYDLAEGHEPTEDPNTYRFMYYWEYPTATGNLPGFANASDEADTVTTDELTTDSNLFLIYDYLPADVVDYEDDITDIPEYLVHVIIAGMLERAFGADCDGFIPTLRDYWKMRKEIGIKAINLFKSLKYRDRDYRLGGYDQSHGRKRYPQLPSYFPATYP